VLMAATSHLRIFPMMTTAAGTITPACVCRRRGRRRVAGDRHRAAPGCGDLRL
jgi:hypothetical protein